MGLFKMPSLGADMEAGTLVEWLKHPGDPVARGDIIAVVETEKGAIEIEIFETGRLEQVLVQPGAKVPVGSPLAIVDGEGSESAVTPTPAPTFVPAPLAALSPAPPLAVVKSAPGLRASPAARKLAAELGIDLATVEGSGPEGAVLCQDVALRAETPVRRAGVDLDQMRRAIAAAMARSKRDIPHYYLSHSLDAGGAHRFVESYNAERAPEDRILIGVLLTKAVAIALRDFPEFNGFYDAAGFRSAPAIHVGLAIAIRGGGLAAPAIHDTDRLSLADLMAHMRDLTIRVRRGGFRSSELSDPTVTVSSLGERGVEALFPVIYPPQVAIIGFGALLPRPWATGETVEVRPVITASLAADHRVSDGHRGALLLRRIEALLSQPELL